MLQSNPDVTGKSFACLTHVYIWGQTSVQEPKQRHIDKFARKEFEDAQLVVTPSICGIQGNREEWRAKSLTLYLGSCNST